jgi:hypothetical protein
MPAAAAIMVDMPVRLVEILNPGSVGDQIGQQNCLKP